MSRSRNYQRHRLKNMTRADWDCRASLREAWLLEALDGDQEYTDHLARGGALRYAEPWAEPRMVDSGRGRWPGGRKRIRKRRTRLWRKRAHALDAYYRASEADPVADVRLSVTF